MSLAGHNAQRRTVASAAPDQTGGRIAMKHSHSAFTIVMLLASAGASADVTVQEQLNLDVASIKAHGTTTRRFTSDKQRTETEFRCDGLLSMLCGKNNGLEIVRLDRGVTLSGEPAKQS